MAIERRDRRASETGEGAWCRREFLRTALLSGGALAAWSLRPWTASAATLSSELLASLEKSPYVYVSPLLADGRESTCHGEIWYAWLDGAAVATVSTDGWKARALAKGLASARLWVGDHGRWKRMGISNDGFRKAPHFDARAEKSTDEALMERLLASYGEKYPDEIDRWRDRMRKGFADGSRTLIRYVPVR